MGKITTLPWIKRQLSNDGDFFIESPKEQIGKPYGQEILADDYFDDFSKESDCDFILKACNNHDALIEALRVTFKALQTYGDHPIIKLHVESVFRAVGEKI